MYYKSHLHVRLYGVAPARRAADAAGRPSSSWKRRGPYRPRFGQDGGESKAVSFELTDRDFSTWSVEDFDWAKCPGDYTARVGLKGANFAGDDSFADVTRTI